MGQIIDLATFQFEDSKLIASIANIQKSLLELKTKVADNNKEYKNNQQSINLLIASQNAMAISGNKNTDAYKANEKSLLDLNNSQTKLLQTNAVLTNNISGLNGNLREQQTALGGLSQTATVTETPYKNLNAEMNAMKLSAKNLGAELIILEREGKKGTAEYKELEKKFKETAESAAKLDKEFKALDGTVGDNQRNVGDYKNQIKEAFSEMNIFNGGIGGFVARSNEAGGAGNLLKNSFNGIKEGVSGATKAAWGFIANPLGVFIAGIAVVVGVLAAAFSKFQPVIDKVQQVMAGVGAVFTFVTESIIGLVTGTKSLSNVFTNLGGSLLKTADSAMKLKKAQQDLEDQQDVLEVKTAKANRLYAEQMILSKNRTLTEEQRVKHLQNAQNIEASIFIEKEKLANEEVRIARANIAEKHGLTNQEINMLRSKGVEYAKILQDKYSLDDEEVNKLKTALLKKEAILAEDVQRRETAQNKKDKLEDDAIAKKEKADSDAQKKADDYAEKAKQKAKEQADAQKKEIDAQIANAQELAIAQIETAKLTLASYLIDNQSKLTDAKRLTQDLINEENKRLDAVLEKNRDILSSETANKQNILNAEIKSLEDKKTLTESEKLRLNDLNVEKLNLSIDYSNKDKELVNTTETAKKTITTNYRNQITEEEKIQKAQKFKLLLNEMELQGANEYQIKSIQLDNETQLELQKLKEKEDAKFLAGVEKRLEQNALLTEEDAVKEQLNFDLQNAKDENEKVRIQNQLDAITLIEQGKADKTRIIDDNVTTAKLQAYASVFGNIANLLGKDTMASKAAGLAQIAIAQGVAIAQIWKAPPAGVAPVDIATKIAGTVTAGVTILGALNQVSNVKAEKGMLLQGNSHANGGIPALVGGSSMVELEGGEAVINKKSTAKHVNLLSLINQDQGGVKFATGGVLGSNLQSVQNNFTQTLDLTAMAEMIGQKVYEGATVGTASGSQKGIIGLSENRQVANSANF